MPKETIHGQGGYDLRVGWSPDCDVQVGVTVQTDGATLLRQLYGSQEAAERIGRSAAKRGWPQAVDSDCDSDSERAEMVRIGREVLGVVEGTRAEDPEATGPGYSGVWSTLDRYSINRLIRSLRKARDSAFGRDE
jgi:hypothetical protein